MSKRIAHQQITKFIMDARDGDAEQRKHSEPNADYREKKKPDDKSFSPGKSGKWPRNFAKCFFNGSRSETRKKNQSQRDADERGQSLRSLQQHADV